MRKKVLIIYPEMMMGGSTTSLINLLNELDYDRYDVDIAFRKKRGSLIDYIPSKVNVLPELDPYPDNKFGKFIKLILMVFTIRFYLALIYKIKKDNTSFNQVAAYNQVLFCKKIKKEYDVVISFLEGFSNIYANSKKVKAKKKINWIHIDYKIAGFNIKHDVKCLKKADKIVFVSDICLEHFKEVAPSLADKLVVIENVVSYNLVKNKAFAYEINDIPKADIESLKLLTVCRLSTNTKGLDRILNITRNLVNRGLNLKWYIIGGNPDNQFRDLYEKYEYKENVILLGEMSNPFPYYKFFDLFVLPSRFEGKPMVVTESLMLNLPVICTRYSSAHEQIENNVDGIIVENSEVELEKIIEKISSDRSILLDLKDNLSKKKFSYEDILSSLDELFNE